MRHSFRNLLTLPLLSATLAGLAHGQISVSIEKELFITNLAVVNHPTEAMSPNGAFHIHTLLDAMAPTGKGAKDVMLSLLGSFRDNASPDLPMRNIDDVIINPWKRWAPGATDPLPEGSPLPNDVDWDVNWHKAPFRLMAIVNRIDLRLNPTIGNAGEGRFVFCMTDPIDGGPLPFTVILEYVQPAADQFEIPLVAADWHALGAHAAFDEAYINALKIVTRKFTARNAAPSRINGSAIGQIRTNDIVLNPSGGPGWELRELTLVAPDNLFKPATVKLTPHHSLDNTPALAFMLRRLGPNVSEAIPTSLFDLRALTRFDPGTKWSAPGFGATDAVLRRFSVNTCNGCHGGDGATAPATAFYHVKPREHGQAAELSQFLTGVGSNQIVDPGTGRLETSFSDLEQRKRGFETLIGVPLPMSVAEVAELREDAEERSVRVH
jgi:hypothetical protein